MEIVINGDTSKFKSSKKQEEFKAFLENCKSEQDFKQVKADDYFVEGYAFTMRKTTKNLIVSVLTEKEAKRTELKMKLKDRIYQKKNGKRDMQNKIKSEKKSVNRYLFKKFMKVINSGQGGANVLSPSDILNDVGKYSQLVSMMSSPMFSKNKHIQEYYDAMREHLGLPEFSMPDIKSEGHSDAIKNAGPIVEEKSTDLTNEQDTEEEKSTDLTNEQDTEEEKSTDLTNEDTEEEKTTDLTNEQDTEEEPPEPIEVKIESSTNV